MFEKYGSDEFTVVGLALDAEGIAPAKLYYDKYNVTFPSLVDPDYATQFGAVPKTFFIDEHGVVQELKDWEKQLESLGNTKPISNSVRGQWSKPELRVDSSAIAKLAKANTLRPDDLTAATQLASRYIALGLHEEATKVLDRAVASYEVKSVAMNGGTEAKLLGQAYFQLMRASAGNRELQVHYATLSYYLNPSIGFAKQIARIIDPAKFDETSNGRLDNTFREATYQRIKRERANWLAE